MSESTWGIKLRAIRGMSKIPMTWLQIFKELFDNSVSADARAIDVIRAGKTIDVTDNGHGCEDLNAMLSVGESATPLSKRPSQVSSEYGMGGVIATLVGCQGTRSEVLTTSAKDGNLWRQHADADWNAIATGGASKPAVTEDRAPKGSTVGTTVRMHNCKKIKDVDKLLEDLAFAYSGEIEKGLAITFRDGDKPAVALKPFQPPPPARGLRRHFEVEHKGHKIRVDVWVVKQGEKNPRPGIHARWRHRVVSRVEGATGGYPINRIFGFIDLPGSWPGRTLSVTKDDFQDDLDPLWDEIADRLKDIFEKSRGLGESIELRDLARDLGDMLSESLCGAKTIKAKRDEGEEQGAVKPTGRGGKHQKCRKSQPGESMVDPSKGEMSPRSFGKIDVRFDPTQAHVFTVAVSGSGARRSLCVTVNEEDPIVKTIRSLDKPEQSRVLLFAQILSWVGQSLASDGPLRDGFPSIKRADYQGIVTDLFASLAEKNGLTVTKSEAA